MDEVTKKSIVRQYKEMCRLEHTSYKKWLSVLLPFNSLTQGGSAVLSLVGGAAILSDPAFLGSSQRLFGGICALIASVLIGLHRGLKCEEHQLHCRNLTNEFEALEMAFFALEHQTDEEIAAALPEEEKKFQALIRKREVTVPDGIIENTRREFSARNRAIKPQ